MPDSGKHSERGARRSDDPVKVLLAAFKELLNLPCEYSQDLTVQRDIADSALVRLGRTAQR